MTFSFHPDARAELNQAVDYYEECAPGLGYEFLEEAYATIARVLQYPDAWSQFSGRARRCLTKRFPYSLIYQVKEDLIRIVAVAHSHRCPGYWINRLNDEPNKAAALTALYETGSDKVNRLKSLSK